MKTIIQACSQHMKHKNESRINMKNNHDNQKHGISKQSHNSHDQYDRNMCIRSYD